MFFHEPVLQKEVAENLITDAQGIYLDGTLGGGGHAEYLLKLLGQKAIYIGIDQDEEALVFARQRLANFNNVNIFKENFERIGQLINTLNISSVNGIFLDLGVSSYQINNAGRGFSYMLNGELDMRMDLANKTTASELLNTLDKKSLQEIFSKYGEEKKSNVIARNIIYERIKKPVLTSSDLKKIILRSVNPKFAIKSYARIFQALRIATNDELRKLESTLSGALELLKTGGRLVVISYHSLEDRIVKTFMRSKANPCICPPDFPQCVCGRIPELKEIFRKGIKASDAEVQINSRARSAIMRVGEKL